jgi:hypothetical protein
MQPVRLARSIVAVAALSLLCSRSLLTQDSRGSSDPTGRGQVGQGAGGPAPLDPSVKRTPVQAGKATGFLYQPAGPGEKARIGVFVMHFGSDYSNFSACSELSTRGYTVLCTKNSAGGLNDILPDARSSVEYLRGVDGVRKVVLWGHSGGATLMTSEATATLTVTTSASRPTPTAGSSGTTTGRADKRSGTGRDRSSSCWSSRPNRRRCVSRST